MKVFAVVYKASFDNEEFDNVYLYDSFEKAHKNFLEIVDGWEDEELFDTKIIDTESGEICATEWDDEKYYGFYSKMTRYEQIYIEERDNVVNYLNVRVEELEVM